LESILNWDAVIAIVEIVGVAGVIASLIYVAIQVRQNSHMIDQNNLATRSSMVHETSVSYNRFFELIVENADVADIYRRGKAGQELEPVEVVRYEALTEIYFSWLEDTDHQYKVDLYFDDEDDTDLVEFMAPVFRDLLMSPYGRNWWDRVAADTYTPNFYKKVTKLVSQWDQ
jgi:hypothetical protein